MRTPAKIRKAAEDLDTETLTKKTEAQGLGLQKSSSALARLWSYITKKKEGSSTTQTINGNSESVKKFSLESGQKVSADTSEEDKEDQLLHSTKPEGQSSNKLKKKVSFNTHEILDNDIADKSDNITSDSKALQGKAFCHELISSLICLFLNNQIFIVDLLTYTFYCTQDLHVTDKDCMY